MSDQSSYTSLGFCKNNAISKSKYHALKRDGLGPREMLVGGSIRISAEAQREWIQQMEKRAASPEAERLSRRTHSQNDSRRGTSRTLTESREQAGTEWTTQEARGA